MENRELSNNEKLIYMTFQMYLIKKSFTFCHLR